MRRVLVVDDDEFVIAGLRRIIPRDYEVISSTSGAEALEFLRVDRKVFAIISDASMPNMDGIRFLESARVIAPHTPRVLLTGRTDKRTVIESINIAGVFHFLEKPVHSKALISCLEDCCSVYLDAVRKSKLLFESDFEQMLHLEFSKDNFLDQLSLAFQPRIDARNGGLAGVEALLRWRHPIQGAISPDVFIPIAEKSRAIEVITNWVVEKSCQFWARCISRYDTNAVIAINVPPSLVQSGFLFDLVSESLLKHDMDPSSFEIEITEGTELANSPDVLASISKLKRLGISISIDDFGSGHTSISYLQFVDINGLKIDKKLVLNAPNCSRETEILRSIVNMANALGLKVIAEGVECETHAALVKELGVDEMQGFHFGKPMQMSAFADWLRCYKPNWLAVNLS